jgi:wee1-like protein kinase
LNDFKEIKVLGQGSFGEVLKCTYKIDGIDYAIKRTTRMIYNEKYEEKILKEVHALATLVSNPYIVRYFAAWIENKRLFIQTELCEGGSLSERVGKMVFTENELLSLLRQILLGLVEMHALNLVHLDLKPENIYIKYDSKQNKIYKIGDFGLAASSLADNERDIEDGDSRYLADELLNEQNPDLTKADIFALGATMYELARGTALPEKGQEWHDIRTGKLKEIYYSKELFSLITMMLHPNPKLRPSAVEILSLPIVQNSVGSREELEKQFISLAATVTRQKEREEHLRQELDDLKKLLTQKNLL